MTLLYSLFRLEVTLENRLYCYFCEAAMTMMLIHLSKCVTLVYNHIDCELSLIFLESVVYRSRARVGGSFKTFFSRCAWL